MMTIVRLAKLLFLTVAILRTAKMLLSLEVSLDDFSGMIGEGTEAVTTSRRVSSSTTTTTTTTTTSTATSSSQSSCGIYMAPSSIPGSGLGMYVGNRDYQKGEIVTLGDVVIPLIEQNWNTRPLHLVSSTTPPSSNKHSSFLWDEYVWNGAHFPYMKDEGDDVKLIMAASPGVGSVANSYLTLANVNDMPTKMSRGGMTGDSPGVGAISPYHGRSFYATEAIPAGGEIFVNYGVGYFKHRTDDYGYLPLPKNFKEADRLIGDYISLKEKMVVNRSSNNKQNNLLDGNHNLLVWDSLWDVITQQASIWKTSRVLNALPNNFTTILDEKTFFFNGGAGKQHFQRSIRDISWLEEHGQCMDNIKVGQSTNPDAGRGAFANRFIPKGGLVAPAPLIHVAGSDYFKMFQPIKDEERPGMAKPDLDGPMTYQLLLNYCFGHEESTLLLCPYGLLTGFINHASSSSSSSFSSSHPQNESKTTTTPRPPNTRVVWSKEMRHPEWRDQDPNKWSGISHTGVAIDFVALRDIKKDEEILIDYGEAWETAWQKHVQTFVPRDKTYVPAYELNQVGGDELVYRTVEQDTRPYEADGVQLWCRGRYVPPTKKASGDVRKEEDKNENQDRPCRILKKLNDLDRYMVELLPLERETSSAGSDKSQEVDSATDPTKQSDEVLLTVSSDALYFVDLPYTRDHQMFNSFRHAMMLPDDMFPEIWKNNKKKK